MLAFALLCILLLIGHWLRTHVRVLRWLYLPACVIAGLIGLAVLSGLEGFHGWVTSDAPLGPLPAWRQWVIDCWQEVALWRAAWKPLPGMLINVVFACLFMGVTLPKFSSVVRRGGIQLAYGQIVAWGQYVVGVGLVLAFLGAAFGISDVFGGVLPVGFEGGHGTASGLEETFEELGWAQGKDFALASATGGIISAIVVGMVLVNIATRRGWTVRRRSVSPADVPEDDTLAIIPVDRRPSAGKLTVKSDAIESFTLHLALVGVAILAGFLLKEGITRIDDLFLLVRDPVVDLAVWLGLLGAAPDLPDELPWLDKLLTSMPLFPLCMVGGLLVQIWEQKFDRHKLIDLGLIRRIQNSALDFLVTAAIATISLSVIQEGLTPLLILIAAGIAWNVLCVLVLAPRLLPDAWFERSIAEMGQSMGVTATGLLLRVVDPDYESPAADAFATKQLMHEPIMGGGLWTSLAIPLLAMWGGWNVWLLCTGAMTFWIVLLVVVRVRHGRRAAAST